MTADELTKLLDELQQRLQGPAKYVFDLAVKQAIINGALPFVFAAVMLVVFVVTVLLGLLVARGIPEGQFEEGDDPRVWIVMGFWSASVIATILGVVALAVGLAGLSNLLNPEWAALQTIITTLK